MWYEPRTMYEAGNWGRMKKRCVGGCMFLGPVVKRPAGSNQAGFINACGNALANDLALVPPFIEQANFKFPDLGKINQIVPYPARTLRNCSVMVFLCGPYAIRHHLNQTKLSDECSLVVMPNDLGWNWSLQEIVRQGIPLKLFPKVMDSLMHSTDGYRCFLGR